MAIAPVGASNMTASSMFASAVSGLQSAEGRFDADAQTIAANGPDVGSMIDLDVQSDTFTAVARVLQTADRMSGTAIDMLA
jgi:hypothetical protein